MQLNNKRVLIVGGGNPHIEAVKKLKDLGYYTIVVDYTSAPPAKGVADKFINQNGFKEDILRKVAKEEKVCQIINLCYDLAMPEVAKVSEELGLYFSFNYEQSLRYTNKVKMKEVMVENSIPTAKYIHSSTVRCNFDSLQFPIVVKPVDSSGSRGITKVSDKSEAESAIKIALENSRTKDVIIEEYISGKEYQVDCVVTDNQTSIILLKQKLKFDTAEVVSPAGSLIIPTYLRDIHRFQVLADSLAKAFSINNCSFFYQCIENDGELNVIELGVRMGGGVSYKMIKQITGFDYMLATLYSQIGKKLHPYVSCVKDYFMTCGIFANEGTISHLKIPQKFDNTSTLDSVDIIKREGDFVNGIITNKNRIAIAILHGLSIDDLYAKMRYLIDNIQIQDSNGDNLFMKDVYLRLINTILEQ